MGHGKCIFAAERANHLLKTKTSQPFAEKLPTFARSQIFCATKVSTDPACCEALRSALKVRAVEGLAFFRES